MPRGQRIWEPGDLLSIVGRGHEGRPLFATDDDRRFFVERLARVFRPGDVDLLGWALLINHYHLMIRVTDAKPESLFRRLNTALGMRERRRRGDHGTVFQGRYWSGRCEKEGAAVSVLTYVLANPCHHGVVPTAEALESYEWTAYGEVLGLASRGLVDPAKSLSLLHPDEPTARVALRLLERQGEAGARPGASRRRPHRGDEFRPVCPWLPGDGAGDAILSPRGPSPDYRNTRWSSSVVRATGSSRMRSSSFARTVKSPASVLPVT